MGVDLDPNEDVSWMIGPPLRHSLALFVPPGRLEEAARVYLDLYEARGRLDVRLFDGVRPMLEALASQGIRLGVATSKSEHNAKFILEHVGIMGFFEAMRGADASGNRSEKPEVLSGLAALMRLEARMFTMVGDRRHDVEGAHELGANAIGALWGYGGREELEAAGADALAEAPSDILRTILHFLET